jgi:formiminotetrahydrofolate cyclodeaminase
MIVALPLLMVAACDVKKDVANDQTTYELNTQKIENSAEAAGNTAENAISDIGNAAKSAGDKIENTVKNVDIKVDVDRNSH